MKRERRRQKISEGEATSECMGQTSNYLVPKPLLLHPYSSSHYKLDKIQLTWKEEGSSLTSEGQWGVLVFFIWCDVRKRALWIPPGYVYF